MKLQGQKMANNFQVFCRYIDDAGMAERQGKIRRAHRYLKQAAGIELDFMQETKVWILEYYETVLHLLYDKKADQAACCNTLLLLRKKAKEGRYSGEILYVVIKDMYTRLLIQVLANQSRRSEDFAEYEEIALEFINIIEKEKQYTIDGKDVYSFMYGVLGVHYQKQGKMALAETYLKKVGQKFQNVECLSQCAFSVLVHLVHIYVFLGNMEKAELTVLFLWKNLEDGGVDCPYQPDVQRLALDYVYILDVTRRWEEANAFMWECMKKKRVYFFSPDDYCMLFYGSYISMMLRAQQQIPHKIIKKISRIIKSIKRRGNVEEWKAWHRCNYYQICYFAEKARKNPNASVNLDRSVRIMKEEMFSEVERQVYFSSMAKAIFEYKQEEQDDKAVQCGRDIMEKLILFYSMAEYYLDNEKMEQYLTVCKIGFQLAYSVLFQYALAEEKLEYSMNYKNIFCSALRLRNQYEDLEHREKHENALKYYKIKDLEKQMPKDSAAIEFLYINPDTWRSGELLQETTTEEVCLEIFAFINKKDRCLLRQHTVRETKDLQKRIHQLTDLLKSGKGKYKQLAAGIYQEILKPLEKDLKEMDRIWISPDRELCSLPFEILLETAEEELSRKNILYIRSFRDFFETWQEDADCGETACVIGNPAFSLGDPAAEWNENFNSRYLTEQAEPLPYSEYEAKTVSGMLGGDCYIRKSASKYTVQSGYRYLHIATHGIRLQEEKNPWYESTLAFSGMVDFLRTGKEQSGYGNGILTADEISRMKLDGTELAVLSACNSGNSIFSKLEQQTGLHIAFGAAGVKYVVSSLWEADDLAAAFFMFYFYEEIKKKASVPRALHTARRSLRNMTVGDVKKLSAWEPEFFQNAEVRERLSFTGVPEGYRLYSYPYYWAGFVCYQFMNEKI